MKRARHILPLVALLAGCAAPGAVETRWTAAPEPGVYPVQVEVVDIAAFTKLKDRFNVRPDAAAFAAWVRGEKGGRIYLAEGVSCDSDLIGHELRHILCGDWHGDRP